MDYHSTVTPLYLVTVRIGILFPLAAISADYFSSICFDGSQFKCVRECFAGVRLACFCLFFVIGTVFPS